MTAKSKKTKKTSKKTSKTSHSYDNLRKMVSNAHKKGGLSEKQLLKITELAKKELNNRVRKVQREWMKKTGEKFSPSQLRAAGLVPLEIHKPKAKNMTEKHRLKVAEAMYQNLMKRKTPSPKHKIIGGEKVHVDRIVNETKQDRILRGQVNSMFSSLRKGNKVPEQFQRIEKKFRNLSKTQQQEFELRYSDVLTNYWANYKETGHKGDENGVMDSNLWDMMDDFLIEKGKGKRKIIQRTLW